MRFFGSTKSRSPAKKNVLPKDSAAALGQLELIARQAVDGLLSGKHRSKHRGGTSDFAEHRSYATGDDIRRIDWKLHARNDRYHVRTYEDETNLRALVVVDASGSMAYEGSTASKFDIARQTASCLTRLLMRQRDSVGLAVIDKIVREEIPAGLRPSTLSRINQSLAAASVAGESDVAGSLLALRPSSRRRGLLVLISDCFGDPGALGDALAVWSAAGHDCIVIEVLAPEEMEFNFRGPTAFEDLEFSGSMLELDAGQIRNLYLERFSLHRDHLREAMQRGRASHLLLRTDDSMVESLRKFLINRRAMTRGGRRRR